MANHDSRISSNMPLEKMIMEISECDYRALKCLVLMQQSNPNAKKDFLLFDELGIYGEKIHKLWNNCCYQDLIKLNETIKAFRQGKFTYEEIQKNLSSTCVKPFM